MGWRDIVRKSNCMSKQGQSCSCSECEKQNFEKKLFDKAGAKPDYIDIDGDGNRTESMKEAARDSEKKAKCPHCDGNGPRSECICGK